MGLTVPVEAQAAWTSATGPVQPKVLGNRLVDARTGQVWTPHGSSWPALEYACVQNWAPALDLESMITAAEWGMDVVRIPLNQDCWLGADGAPVGANAGTMQQYRARVQSWVNEAHAAGMVVILDLHWTAPSGTLAAGGQWPMADEQSVDFWSSIAAAYKDDPSVMFELFNEPYSRAPQHILDWECWRDGGCQMPNVPEGQGLVGASLYTVRGMAELVAAVRAAGAQQPILLGGLNYANDLSQWLTHKPNDRQLVASWHNYRGQGCSDANCWNREIAPVAARVPILMTEFGYEPGASDYFASAMDWADSMGMGYLPWAWWNQASAGNTPYALYTGNGYTPTEEGEAFSLHLASLPRWRLQLSPLALLQNLNANFSLSSSEDATAYWQVIPEDAACPAPGSASYGAGVAMTADETFEGSLGDLEADASYRFCFYCENAAGLITTWNEGFSTAPSDDEGSHPGTKGNNKGSETTGNNAEAEQLEKPRLGSGSGGCTAGGNTPFFELGFVLSLALLARLRRRAVA